MDAIQSTKATFTMDQSLQASVLLYGHPEPGLNIHLTTVNIESPSIFIFTQMGLIEQKEPMCAPMA